MIDFKQAAKEVLDGKVDPLEVYAQLKQMKKDLDESLKVIEEEAREEALKYGEKHFEHKGFKIEIRAGSTRYNFSNIQEVKKKEDELKNIKEKYKQAYKSYEKGITSLDDDEILELPEAKTSRESIVIKPK